jgi:hypothetical protein
MLHTTLHDEQLNYFLVSKRSFIVAGVVLPSSEVFAASDMLACTSAFDVADCPIVGDVMYVSGDDAVLCFC